MLAGDYCCGALIRLSQIAIQTLVFEAVRAKVLSDTIACVDCMGGGGAPFLPEPVRNQNTQLTISVARQSRPSDHNWIAYVGGAVLAGTRPQSIKYCA